MANVCLSWRFEVWADQQTYMRSSKTNVREVGAVSVVDLCGLLMLGESTQSLRQTVSELVERQRNKIILNFRDVTAVDSAGIGELLAAYTAIKAREGRLKLLSPPQKVRDMLTLTQLSRVLEVYYDEESAFRSFE